MGRHDPTEAGRRRRAPLRRASLLFVGGLLGLGCSLFVDVDGLSTTKASARSGNPTADSGGGGGEGGSSTIDGGGGNPNNEGGVIDDRSIAFGGVAARGLYADTCPCTLTAPAVSGPNPIMLFGVSINAHDEDLPNLAMYNNIDLGPPDETLRVPYTRLAVWHLTNPPSGGNFTIRWPPAHGENAVMMAAVYTNVDQANPYRSPPERANGPQPPALLPSPSGPQSADRIVSFFALNDTSLSRGLTAARVGQQQTFRAQQSNDSEESQIALSDSPIDPVQNPHRWDYTGGSPWTGVALLLAHAP